MNIKKKTFQIRQAREYLLSFTHVDTTDIHMQFSKARALEVRKQPSDAAKVAPLQLRCFRQKTQQGFTYGSKEGFHNGLRAKTGQVWEQDLARIF